MPVTDCIATSVDVTLVSAGVTVHTVSSDAGLYVFPNLPTGIWTISAEKPGFKKLVRTGIEIFIAQRQALDLKLEVGDVKQTRGGHGQPVAARDGDQRARAGADAEDVPDAADVVGRAAESLGVSGIHGERELRRRDSASPARRAARASN